MNTNKCFAFLGPNHWLKSLDLLYQNILLYFMYIFSDAMTANTVQSFCWPSIPNKFSVEN